MNHNFNPNSTSIDNGNFFGFTYSEDEARIIIYPVPWDVTTSYNDGTSNAYEHIRKASLQIDFYDPDLMNAWKYPVSIISKEKIEKINLLNKENRKIAKKYIKELELLNKQSNTLLNKINNACENLQHYLFKECLKILNKDKQIALLGGEHSISYAYIKALSTKYNNFSILQIDAHADLRKAYQNIKHSHASVMYNVLELDNISNLVQVAVRDICPDEINLINDNPKIQTFFDWDIKKSMFNGKNWNYYCKKITDLLDDNVYISFDIDGLDTKLCPNTGTPVPGGLQFNEAIHLIRTIVNSGKKIIGFDLVEVAIGKENKINEITAAYILYKLCNFTHKSMLR